ncbi:MAG: MFS transporter, partial [Pseudomonadota bacterium]
LRASEGVTWTIMFSTGLLLTAEMAPRHRLAQAIGIAGGAALIMNAIAPAIGEPIADRFGYRPVFLLAAVAALVAAGMARRLPKSTAAGAPRDAGTPVPEITDHPARRLRLYFVFGMSGLAFSSLFTFLGPFALAHGVRAIRGFFIAYTCSALVVRVLGGRLADRLGHRAIATFALVLYGLVVASTGFLGPRHMAVLGVLFGLAHGAVFPAVMALLINNTSAVRRPRVLGIANGAMSIGISAVFPAGMLVGRFGYPAMFAIAGGLVAASAALIRKEGASG